MLTGRIVNWSATPGILSVSSSGIVTGIAIGSGTVTATIDGIPGTAAVTVTQVPVASVSVTPTAVTTFVGQTVSLSATTLDANNNVLTGRVITWSGPAFTTGDRLPAGLTVTTTSSLVPRRPSLAVRRRA